MGFRICTIGCGSLATTEHGPSYRRYADAHPDVELAACCDLDEQKARMFQEQFGFTKSYTDIDAMLDAEQPDAVCMVVPTALTAELSVRVLNKGFPLLMEKPPGLRISETLCMMEAASENHAPTQVSFNRRYMPLLVHGKQWISKQVGLSAIHNIRYDFYRVGRKDEDFSQTAIHGVDAVKFLAGSDYKHVRFHYQPLPQLGSSVVNIFMDCEFESGVTAQLNFCPATGAVVEHATIHAINHTFVIRLPIWSSPDRSGGITHLINNAVVREADGTKMAGSSELYVTNGFYGSNASFFDDIRAGRRPQGDLRSSLQSVDIMECMRIRLAEYYW